MISGTTGILGICGHPVGHSLSPAMQNEALKACGLNCVYVPFDVPPEHIGQAVQALRALGILGVNVTVPHKTAVMPFLDQLDRSARLAGAVNVIANQQGVLTGYNTDGAGLVRSLKEDLNVIVSGKRIMIIGAGGAARGAVAALCDAGCRRISISNRSRERADLLAEMITVTWPGVDGAVVTPDHFSQELASADLLINTTTLGMRGEAVPGLNLSDLPLSAAVYDMVYAPSRTPLLQEAESRGIAWANGLGMLAAQGELAFEIWTGCQAPAGLMKSVLARVCEP